MPTSSTTQKKAEPWKEIGISKKVYEENQDVIQDHVFDFVHERFKEEQKNRFTICYAYSKNEFHNWQERLRTIRYIVSEAAVPAPLAILINPRAVTIRKPRPAAHGKATCNLSTPSLKNVTNVFRNRDGEIVTVQRVKKWVYDGFDRKKGRDRAFVDCVQELRQIQNQQDPFEAKVLKTTAPKSAAEKALEEEPQF